MCTCIKCNRDILLNAWLKIVDQNLVSGGSFIRGKSVREKLKATQPDSASLDSLAVPADRAVASENVV